MIFTLCANSNAWCCVGGIFSTLYAHLQFCAHTQLISDPNGTGAQWFHLPYPLLPITLPLPTLSLAFNVCMSVMFFFHISNYLCCTKLPSPHSIYLAFLLTSFLSYLISLQSAALLLFLITKTVRDCSTTHCEREHGVMCSGTQALFSDEHSEELKLVFSVYIKNMSPNVKVLL